MKDSEKKLLFAFVGVLAIAALAVLFKFYQGKRLALKIERIELEEQMVRIDELLQNRDLWMARADWLDRHQPRYSNEETVTNLIYRDSSAEGIEGVTVTSQKLLNEVRTEHYIQAGVSLSATGSLESVFKWLYQLQQPGEFRVVSGLQVRPDKDDDTNIVCKFDLYRWYAPN